jgi:glycosyltransferase involved in cell wall biosynthesis
MTNNQIKRINHVAPFFSLIMPVYNGQKFLQQALESVLRQTFSDFELIVVDDGSTDASPEIVQELLSKISVLNTFSNQVREVLVRHGILV